MVDSVPTDTGQTKARSVLRNVTAKIYGTTVIAIAKAQSTAFLLSSVVVWPHRSSDRLISEMQAHVHLVSTMTDQYNHESDKVRMLR